MHEHHTRSFAGSSLRLANKHLDGLHAVLVGLAAHSGLLSQVAVAGHIQGDIPFTDLIGAFTGQCFAGRIGKSDVRIIGKRGHGLAGGLDIPWHGSEIGDRNQHAHQHDEDGQTDHEPVEAGPRLGLHGQTLLFLWHERLL